MAMIRWNRQMRADLTLAVLEGRTLREVGERYGVGVERTRQVVFSTLRLVSRSVDADPSKDHRDLFYRCMAERFRLAGMRARLGDWKPLIQRWRARA